MSQRPYRLGKRAESAAATRERIIESGWAEIEAAGYRPVTIEAIAARAGVTRMTVYRHFATRGELLAAIAWARLAQARLDRLDAARAQADVVDATRGFLEENCRLMAEVGGILRTMLNHEIEEPELSEILQLTYRGRRIDSIRELAGRIATSARVAPGWTKNEIADALTVLTSVETFEQLTSNPPRKHPTAAKVITHMAGAFFSTAPK